MTNDPSRLRKGYENKLVENVNCMEHHATLTDLLSVELWINHGIWLLSYTFPTHPIYFFIHYNDTFLLSRNGNKSFIQQQTHQGATNLWIKTGKNTLFALVFPWKRDLSKVRCSIHVCVLISKNKSIRRGDAKHTRGVTIGQTDGHMDLQSAKRGRL